MCKRKWNSGSYAHQLIMDVQKKNGTREEGKLCPPLEFNGYNRKNGAMEQRNLSPPLDISLLHNNQYSIKGSTKCTGTAFPRQFSDVTSIL